MDIDKICLEFGDEIIKFGAVNVQIYEVEAKTKTTKRVMLCTGKNALFNKDLANWLLALDCEIKPLHIDGLNKGEWVVLDYGDFILHILTKENRIKYNLEKFYKSGKNVVSVDRINKN